MDDRSSPHGSTPASDATEYGKRSPFQAARPEPMLTRAMPVAGEDYFSCPVLVGYIHGVAVILRGPEVFGDCARVLAGEQTQSNARKTEARLQ